MKLIDEIERNLSRRLNKRFVRFILFIRTLTPLNAASKSFAENFYNRYLKAECEKFALKLRIAAAHPMFFV